jgi:DNA-binding IscR family transcriptional regulator
MNLKQVKEIAKAKGVKVGKMNKENIIRAIQKAEGNFECFGTAQNNYCDQNECLWREDCLK